MTRIKKASAATGATPANQLCEIDDTLSGIDRQPPKGLRWQKPGKYAWLRQFSRRYLDVEGLTLAWHHLIVADEREYDRFWGLDSSRNETDQTSWHVPPDTILPSLRDGQPIEMVWQTERFVDAAKLGTPFLSATLRREAGIMTPSDDALLSDLELASIAKQLYDGEISLRDALTWTGEFGGHERYIIESRIYDFARWGR